MNRVTCAALGTTRLLWAGFSEARGLCFIRTPPFGQILVTEAGRGRAWADGRWQWCEPGTALLTPAHAFHAYHTAGRQPWHTCWVLYDEDAHPPRDRIIAVPGPTLVGVDPRPIKAAVAGLYYETTAESDADVIRTWAGLIETYARRAVAPRAPADTLWPLWMRVEGDLARPWSLGELAGLADTSPENLRLICHRLYGRSPMQRLTQLRMRRAEALLQSTDMKVSAVARAVGYDSAFAFSTAFRRHLGRTPASARARGRAARPPDSHETPS